MQYQSVSELLDGQWEEQWESLSDAQRNAWEAAAQPLFKWTDLLPEQRQSVAAQHDQRNNPANQEENSFWFNNAFDIYGVECEIREIERLQTPIPSERAEKMRQLDDAHQRLAKLKSAQFQPSTGGGVSSGSNAEQVSDTANPVTKPLPAQRYQEEEILRIIHLLEMNPMALPKDVPGKPGVKKQIRSELEYSNGVFDKAWERLRQRNEIQKLK